MSVADVEGNEERLFLRKLDKKCIRLQQKGRHLEAMALMEQGVESRRHIYGPYAPEVADAILKLCLLCNSLAMSALYKEEYAFALECLRKADALSSATQTMPVRDPAAIADDAMLRDQVHMLRASLAGVRVQTLNNLACVYRRMRKPRTALNLLRQCITLCARMDDENVSGVVDGTWAGGGGGGGATGLMAGADRQQRFAAHMRLGGLGAGAVQDGRAATHLNMCAILSQMGSHEQALEHAQAAVMHAQKRLLSAQLRRELGGAAAAQGGSSQQQQQHRHALLTEKIVVLGLAYHNMGVEEEQLKRGDKCLQWYYKALELANEHLGHEEEITVTFRESYLAAKKQLARRGALLAAAAAAQQRDAARHG